MDDADKARYARSLLNDPVMQEVFASLEQQYFTAFQKSDALDVETRESVYYRLGALSELKRDLQSIVDGQAVVNFNGRLRNGRR